MLQDEAFALWMEKWGAMYQPSSPSYNIINQICSSYYLVNLVDNDFPKDSILWTVIDDMLTSSGVLSE